MSPEERMKARLASIADERRARVAAEAEHELAEMAELLRRRRR